MPYKALEEVAGLCKDVDAELGLSNFPSTVPMLSLSESNFSLKDFGLIAAFNTWLYGSMACSQFSVSCVIFDQKYSHPNCSGEEEPPRLNWGHKGVPLPWFS